jgi:hypothetical protein
VGAVIAPRWTLFWAAALAAGCSSGPEPVVSDGTAKPTAEPSPPPSPPPAGAALAQYGLEHVGVDLPGEDVCEKNADGSLAEPVPEGRYEGLLRNAKCEQQKFLTMARVAQALGVECKHCHAPDPADPKKERYEVMTDNKRIANWMFRTFIQGLREADGSKMMCKSCHVDRKTGKPVAKILAAPRDLDHAQEWMNEVMTTRFVEAIDKRLKCRTCHAGMAPGQPGWIEDVIRHLKVKDSGVERRPDVASDQGT